MPIPHSHSKREHERGVPELVEAAARRTVVSASGISATAVLANEVGVLLREGRGLILDLDVVVVDEVPDGADVATAVLADHRLRHVAVDVRRVLHVVAEVVLGRVFGALEDAVVVVLPEVHALVVRRLRKHAEQGDVEHGVALVAAGLCVCVSTPL